MSTKTKIISVTIAIVFILYSVAMVWGGVETGKALQYRDDIVIQMKLEFQVDSLQVLVNSVEQDYQFLDHTRDSLNFELEKTKASMVQIQKKYDEQIKSIVDYSNPKLEQFFLERYSSN